MDNISAAPSNTFALEQGSWEAPHDSDVILFACSAMTSTSSQMKTQKSSLSWACRLQVATLEAHWKLQKKVVASFVVGFEWFAV